MVKYYNSIPDFCFDWIKEQKLLFVATAPLNGKHVNLSPKGHSEETFKVVDANTFWYLDLTGSGTETISHINEPGNGRITVMFCAFDGPPRILRLFGNGTVYLRDTPEFNERVPPGSPRRLPGARAIIEVDIFKVATSCGYAVPKYKYLEARHILENGMSRREKIEKGQGMRDYWKMTNTQSLDGLPSLPLDFVNSSEPLSEPFSYDVPGYGPDGKPIKPSTKTVLGFF